MSRSLNVLYAIYAFSSVKCLFISFAYFLILLLFNLGVLRVFKILYIQVFVDISFVNIFSQSEAHLFILLTDLLNFFHVKSQIKVAARPVSFEASLFGL